VLLDGLSIADSISGRENRLQEKKVLQIVMFHHIYDHEEAAFAEFLRWFTKLYHVISYSEAVARVTTGNIDRPYGAITFDDGLKSIVPAAKIMSDVGVSGCFFVCPGIVGETDPATLRKFCVDTRMDYESDEFANWDELQRLRDLGHEIGSHTVHHPEMNTLSTTEIVNELGESRDTLISRFGSVEHFAWPYGAIPYFPAEAVSLVQQAGYASCASGLRGSHAAHQQDQLPMPCLRRDNMEANWPLRHIKHFLLANAAAPVPPSNWWPADWAIPPKNNHTPVP
jgi:peptidoglycan/xylan/chitin deacetylase (PgdA/CDA1 family)